MNGLVRITFGLGLVIALTTVVARILPESLVGPGLDGESAWDLAVRLVYEDQREESLEKVRETVVGRVARREKIVQELAEGRLTLREAAAGFRRLNELTPDFVPAYRKGFPGATADESLCRQVIYWVANVLERDEPERVRAVKSRLEAELESHLRRDGTVHLPDS
jgi:hypothetical protein